jgi:SRSO17 transposase
MTDAELGAVRERLEAFAMELFAPMRRRDQRDWGCVYLRGLMLEGRRKSIQPIAERLSDGDEQCLQQFVNQSPWDWAAVRERLALRMSEEIGAEAWIVDDTGFPKAGRHSVGVARQYCGALGKLANCQVGVSISAATDEASCPLNWRLFIPVEWDEDQERRREAHLPDDIRHAEKWKLALEAIDELRDWGIRPPVLLADSGYGEINEFRAGLEQRDLGYVVQVKGGASAYAEGVRPERADYAGVGPRPKPRYGERPSSLRRLALDAGPEAAVELAWREGIRGELSSRFLALRVRPANIGLRNRANREGKALAVRWLLCEWPAGKPEPVKYWLSNLPAEIELSELVRLAKLRWRIEHDYRELKDALGLDHFEGRSFRGWHHHTTLVSVAHAFLTTERLRLEAQAHSSEDRPDNAAEDRDARRPFARAA